MIEVLNALGYVVLEEVNGALGFVSAPPDWCSADVTGQFPFLETFLIEAGEFWQAGASGALQSGAWVQADADGNECAFEAVAIAASGRRFLLLRLLGDEYEERRQALQFARTSRLEQGRLNRMKDEFLSAMSHELRTPLNAILGFSSLLERGKAGALNERQQTFVEQVSKAANHLLSLINDVLDLSKIEAGRLRLELEAFRLGDVVTEVLETMKPVAEVRGVALQADPECFTLAVYADPTRLKQILYNLLSNGIKFTSAGGSVRIEACEDERRVSISVADTGIGIRPEDRITVFDRFHQLSRARGEGRAGTGLGLAIVRKLVEEHGGSITVDSEPGKGSCFTFTVPSVFS